MKKQNNREANDRQPLIEDLTISEDQAREVKGGSSVIGSSRTVVAVIDTGIDYR